MRDSTLNLPLPSLSHSLTSSLPSSEKSGASSQPKFLGDDREESESSSDSASSSSSSGSDNQGLDENLLEFIVSEDEQDEDNVKIVNAYREEISNQAQGLKFYLKVSFLFIFA